MNLLQSLAVRTLETAGMVEPPRVPFVNAFPALDAETKETGAEPESAAPVATRHPAPPRSRPAPLMSAPPPTQPHGTEPPSDRERPLPPRGRSEAPPPRVEPAPFPEERTVERWMTAQPGPVPASASPSPPAEPAAPALSSERLPAPEVRETHHHWVERRVEHVVETVEPSPAAPPPSPPPVEPRARRGVTAPPPPITARDAAPPRVAPAVEGPASPPRDIAPSIHVSIGRVVVKVQPATAPARSETTRPVAPAVGLEAYTAARRRRER